MDVIENAKAGYPFDLLWENDGDQPHHARTGMPLTLLSTSLR